MSDGRHVDVVYRVTVGAREWTEISADDYLQHAADHLAELLQIAGYRQDGDALAEIEALRYAPDPSAHGGRVLVACPADEAERIRVTVSLSGLPDEDAHV